MRLPVSISTLAILPRPSSGIGSPALSMHGGCAVFKCECRQEAIQAARGGTFNIMTVELILRAVTRAFKAEVGFVPLGQAAEVRTNAVKHDQARVGCETQKRPSATLYGAVCHRGHFIRREAEDAAERPFLEARQGKPDESRPSLHRAEAPSMRPRYNTETHGGWGR